MQAEEKPTTVAELGSGISPPLVRADVLAGLSAEDRALWKQMSSELPDYVDSPDLADPNIEVELFGAPAQLVAPGVNRFETPPPVADRRLVAATRVPTLTMAQERTLFLRLSFARRFIGAQLQRYSGKQLPEADLRFLLAWGRREVEARDSIVQLNMPLVLAMAKRTRLSGVDFNEMISEGNMALLRSVDKFDCGRGYKFSTYACRAILKSFSRVAMRAGRYRCTFPVEYDPSIERSDHLERKRDNIEENCVDELRTILTRNMASLTDVEQTVIRERFALEAARGESPQPKTLEQVGAMIGVTKERVRQIQNKALRKIRHALEESYLAA